MPIQTKITTKRRKKSKNVVRFFAKNILSQFTLHIDSKLFDILALPIYEKINWKSNQSV